MFKFNISIVRLFKISILIAIMITWMCFNSCSKDETPKINNNIIEIKLDNYPIQKELPLSAFCNNFELIFLQVNNRSLIGDISEINIYSNNIYVLDTRISKSLFVFDFNGNFIRTIGQTGNGPGEYIRPDCFTINKSDGSIYIVDNSKKRVNKYSNTGIFIKDFQCDNNVISIVSQDDKIYLKHQPLLKKNKYLISKINDDGKIKNTYLPIPENSKNYYGGLLSNGYSFNSLDKEPKFITPFGENVYEIVKGEIYQFISINSTDCVNENDVKKFIDLEMKDVDGYDYIKETHKIFSNKFRGIDSYSETKDIFLIKSIYKKVSLNIIYYFKSKKYVLFNRIFDDLTNFRYSLQFLNSTNDCLISVISGRDLEEFISNSRNGLVKLSQKEMDYINKMENEINPIIVLYKTKYND